MFADSKSTATWKARCDAPSGCFKRQDPVQIKKAYDLGQREFGENYCQEMHEKSLAKELSGCKLLRWVFIGQLQSNKIKKIVEISSEIQSLASLKHGRIIERSAKNLGKAPFPVYLLVNTGSELSKGGISWEELSHLREVIVNELPGLDLQGLMAIPPKIDLQEKSMEYYEQLYSKICLEARKTGKGLLSLNVLRP